MLYPGEINRLKIMRSEAEGLYLADKVGNEVLLPKDRCDSHFKTGDLIEVFVYYDKERKLTCTTREPLITAGEFALLNVIRIEAHGVLLEAGMEEPLLLPQTELSKPTEPRSQLMVFAWFDDATKQVLASSKINKYLELKHPEVEEREEVDILVFEETFLGYNVIVNNRFKGLVYKNETFRPLHIGDRMTAYVKKIRDDQALDISLQKPGIMHLADTSDQILHYLKHHDGKLELNDNSSPEAIYQTLQMSKKAFKKSVGILYRQRMIRLENDAIYLNT